MDSRSGAVEARRVSDPPHCTAPAPVHDRAVAAPAIAATLATLIGLFTGGYWVYTHIVGRLLFQAESASILPTGLVLALAVLAGAASFFSPCSLAISPAFLTYFVQQDARRGSAPRGGRLLSAAVLIAIGIVGISVVAGVLFGVIGAFVYDVLIYLIPLVGAVFAALGVMMLLGRGARLAWASHYLPGHRYYERLLSDAAAKSRGELIAFGIAYGAASHSCTLPVLIGILMLPLAAGSYWLAAVAVLLYGMALAGLMLLMLVLGQPALAALRRWTGPYLQSIIGGLFLATGVYLFYYFLSNYGFTFAF